MYATCLFCNYGLGANDSLECFPVGRRLAYDGATGRLWVVCRQCERWNLSPLEARWEAIEEAERAFRSSRVRVSSDNIAMARLRDRTELVRIGKPPRLELAVWRYGDQFGRRYWKSVRRTGLYTTAGAAFVAASTTSFWLDSAALTSLAWFAGAGSLLPMGGQAVWSAREWVAQFRTRTTLLIDDTLKMPLNRIAIEAVSFDPSAGGEDWKLRIPHFSMKPTGVVGRMLGVRERAHEATGCVVLGGAAATGALTQLLPHVNKNGGNQRDVSAALNVISASSDAQALLHRVTSLKPAYRADYHLSDGRTTLAELPAPLRLALEMSLHEDDERRAMEGELSQLEQRWRDADTIARIADNLLVPGAVDLKLMKFQERRDRTGEHTPSRD